MIGSVNVCVLSVLPEWQVGGFCGIVAPAILTISPPPAELLFYNAPDIPVQKSLYKLKKGLHGCQKNGAVI